MFVVCKGLSPAVDLDQYGTKLRMRCPEWGRTSTCRETAVLCIMAKSDTAMTALGQNRKYSLRADDVRSTPESGLKSDIAPCPFRAKNRHGPLFDHLVGAGEERRWNGEAEGLGGLEVDRQLEFGWLLHWQIGRLGTF